MPLIQPHPVPHAESMRIHAERSLLYFGTVLTPRLGGQLTSAGTHFRLVAAAPRRRPAALDASASGPISPRASTSITISTTIRSAPPCPRRPPPTRPSPPPRRRPHGPP